VDSGGRNINDTFLFLFSLLHPYTTTHIPTTFHFNKNNNNNKMYIPNVSSILAAGLALTGMEGVMKKRTSSLLLFHPCSLSLFFSVLLPGPYEEYGSYEGLQE
jgi:hypothetical protein